MEIIILVILVIAVAAYYGLMQSVETLAEISSREVSHLNRQHKISVVTRTKELADEVSEEDIVKINELQAKLDSLKF